MNIQSRLKNVYFWIGLGGIALSAGGVDFTTLTNWGLLLDAIVGILANPVALVGVFMAVIGVLVDTSTPGISDK